MARSLTLLAAAVVAVIAAAWLGFTVPWRWPVEGSRCLGAPPETPVAKPGPEATKNAKEAAPIDPMSANGACYVCHMAFVKEEISRVHFKAKVACSACHGVSDKHANDENIGATKPDVTFRHDQVDALCAKCHDHHDASAKKVIARFVERRLPANPPPVCTDCHGAHKIEKAKTAGSP